MKPESPDVQQLDVKNKGGPRRDVRRSTGSAVSQICRNNELPVTTDFHPGNALIPAGDDLPGPQSKAERLIAIAAAVELLPIRQPARVVDRHGAVCGGFGALTRGDVLIP